MGNYSYFCGSVSRDIRIPDSQDKSPWLEAKYYIPLFWLAAFDLDDCVVVQRDNDRFTVLRCSAAVGAMRLRRRRQPILDLVGERFGALYDAWVEFVETRYPNMILVHTADLFSMGSFERGDSALRRAVAALAPADRGEALTDRDALEGFVHLAGPDEPGHGETAAQAALRGRAIFAGWGTRDEHAWPPPPTPEEVAWIESFVEQERSSPSALELSAELEAALREEVGMVWAWAIAPIALHALAGRGDLEAVRTIARRIEPDPRAALLAWTAWLDPDPRSPGATRAALEALQASPHLAVLALIPLEDPAVLALARSRTEDDVQAALALRLGEPTGVASTPPRSAVLDVISAMRLHQLGRREEAEAALTQAGKAFAVDLGTALATVRAAHELSAHDLLPIERWMWDLFPGCEVAFLAAGFMAGRVGEDAVQALADSLEPGSTEVQTLLGAAALGRGEMRSAWRAALADLDEEQVESLYAEEEVSGTERRSLQFALAAAGANAREAVDALVAESMAAARDAAQAFVESVEKALAAPARDEEAIAGAAKQLEKLLGDARRGKLSAKDGLAKVARQARVLGEAGGAVELSGFLAGFEEAWGPAEDFREAIDPRNGTSYTLEILGCAAGHAVRAARLDEEHNQGRPASRALVVAGLVRDGEPEEARAMLERLFQVRLEADALARLSPFLRLDPEAPPRLRETLAREMEELPELLPPSAA